MNLLWWLLRRQNLINLPPGIPRTAIDVLVDRYVLSWTAAALIVYPLSFVSLPTSAIINVVLAAIVIAISAWRIIEITTFHLNMLISRAGRPGAVPTVASYERSFVLMVANYIEITMWFAAWHSILVRSGAFSQVPE
ncbi:MAG: hypothetical protein ACREUZ_13345, partial [Burkholderiales bacterium]